MDEEFEVYIRQIARDLPYPPTPQDQQTIGVPESKLWMLRYVASFVIFVGLIGIAVLGIQAAVTKFLQFGAVTIYLEGLDAEGSPLELDDISGATTIMVAQDAVNFDILLPPDNPPDHVFLQCKKRDFI